MSHINRSSAIVTLLMASTSFCSPASADPCEALKGRTFGGATVTEATPITSPLTVKNMDPPIDVVVDPGICRIEAQATPTNDSDIRFEVWLPPVSAWNGRYQGIGNGGFAGSLIYTGMKSAVISGYVTSGTDTGHSADFATSDWAIDHPEKVDDFGWRAVHVAAEASKAIIEAYYGKGPEYSYFNGCSDGGREALMEAQRFPLDYDGIIAGAPANYWTDMMAKMVKIQKVLAPADAWLTETDLSTISNAVRAHCPSEKGYVEDPASCNFDAKSLLCAADQNAGCLSDAKVNALSAIYGVLENADTQSSYPGYTPGSEDDPLGWGMWITGSEPDRGKSAYTTILASGFYRDFVYDGKGFNASAADLAAILADSAHFGASLNAVSPDLTEFERAGGKLIQYHGWNDSAIPAKGSITYYDSVLSKMGGAERVGQFYRLFMAPGMQHCADGNGPNAVGALWGLPAAKADADHDIVSALDRWVTEGIAPERIVATKYKDNDPAKGVEGEGDWTRYFK